MDNIPLRAYIMQIQILTTFKDIAVIPYIKPNSVKWDGEQWVTLTTLSFILDGAKINIPSGFITNFGSVPKFLRHIVDPADTSLLAFILHDWLYSKDTLSCKRKYADTIMFKVARMCGQSWWEARKAFLGVRAGGGLKFKNCTATHVRISNELIDKICFDNRYFPDSTDVIKRFLGT